MKSDEMEKLGESRMIQGKKIYLRDLHVADAEKMVETTQNEEIRYLTGTNTAFTLEQIREHIQRIQKNNTRFDFAIVLKERDEMIGELSILDIDERDESAGFRIAMRNMEVTGKGYGTEAIQLIFPFVFEELQLNRLQLEVYSHNQRGIRAYEKVGFVREGVLRQAIKLRGNFSDEIIMSVITSDYEKIKE